MTTTAEKTEKFDACEDFFTHQDAWRKALVAMRDNAEPPTIDTDERAYWQHQLDVFDRVCEAVK